MYNLFIFRIIQATVGVDDESMFETVFTTKGLQMTAPAESVQTRNEISSYSSRIGLRNRDNRKSYAEFEEKGVFYFGYGDFLDLFAVVAIDEEEKVLRISVYENSTKKLFKRLQPVSLSSCLSTRSHRKRNMVSDVQVNFTDDYIAIGLKICSENMLFVSSELLFVNLLAEQLQD
jgi:hypothetical protein